MAAFQQPWFCEPPFGVSTRFQPPSKMNTAIVRFMESCFSKLRFHKWGTVGQRPKFCVLWSGLEIGAWPVSCVRFSVAKQNKSRLETKARSHAAADSTGPPARGRGAEKEGSRSVGVSRGGRNTKVRVVSDSESTLVRIHLSPGDEHDAAHGRRPWAARTRGIRPGCRPSRSA